MNIKSINIQREISNSDFNSLRKWKLVKSTKTIIFCHVSNSYFNRLNITLYKVILHPLLEYNKLENKFSKLASNPQKPKRSKRKIVHNNPRLHNFISRKLKNRVSSRPTYKGFYIRYYIRRLWRNTGNETEQSRTFSRAICGPHAYRSCYETQHRNLSSVKQRQHASR